MEAHLPEKSPDKYDCGIPIQAFREELHLNFTYWPQSNTVSLYKPNDICKSFDLLRLNTIFNNPKMKFGQIKNSLIALLEDSADAEAYLESNPNSQFARRTYIRSIFASIEGTTWILKGVCFNVKPVRSSRTMNIADYALLKEEFYELKTTREAAASTKVLRLPDNIKFIFQMINKRFCSEIDCRLGKSLGRSY